MQQVDLNTLIFLGGLLLTSAVFISKISSLLGAPILLLFLILGMLVGEDGIIFKITYNDYSSAFYIANIMLAIIILDGGLRIKIKTMKQVANESLILATVGVVITSLITGIAAYLVFNELSIVEALLIGATVGSTDAAAVFLLLGGKDGVNLKSNVQATLQTESATNDPMAILLTLVFLSIITGQSSSAISVAQTLFNQFSIGILLGCVFGFIGRYIILKININEGLYALLVLGLGLLGFSITSVLNGSGFLAIFIIGVLIGNLRSHKISYVLPASECLTWLSQITLFFMLGLLVTPHRMLDYILGGVLVAIVLTFIARPTAVFLCLKPFFHNKYSNKALIFLSWVGLRGSVPIVLSLYPVMAGLTHSQVYFNVAFIVVLFSLFVQGASLVKSAKKLKVHDTQKDISPLCRNQFDIDEYDDYQIFSYKVIANTIENKALKDINFPNNTKIATIFREGHVIYVNGDTTIALGDIINVIGLQEDEERLNEIFFNKKITNLKIKEDLEASLKMDILNDQYDLNLSTFEKKLCLGQFISYHLGGFAKVGDELNIEKFRFVVADIIDNQVNKVILYNR